MVLFDRAMIELSSLVASVTIRLLGFFFFLRIAVEVSSSGLFSEPEASLLPLLVQRTSSTMSNSLTSD